MDEFFSGQSVSPCRSNSEGKPRYKAGQPVGIPFRVLAGAYYALEGPRILIVHPSQESLNEPSHRRTCLIATSLERLHYRRVDVVPGQHLRRDGTQQDGVHNFGD